MVFGSRKSAKNGPVVGDPKLEAPQVTPPDLAGAAPAAVEASAGAAPQGGPFAEAPPAGAQPAAASAEAQQAASQVVRQALAFTQVVTVLMRSPHYKHFALADLEWLVLPPILTGQYCVAEVKKDTSAPGVPGAVALWALVSPDVDKRLTESAGAAIRLRPDEWRSGDILWLIAVIGDQRVVPQLLKNLGETTFKGRDVRTRARGPDGKPNVTILRVTGDGAAFARAVMGPAAPNARP